MNDAAASSSAGAAPDREPRSLLYVASSATIAAVILGLTIFLLLRGFQWRGALADLRAEPGIEILSVERSGFFKKRLLGLRDPLAPSAESILLKHNIGPHAAEVVLTEYHSLNTKYAEQRADNQDAHVERAKEEFLKALSEFTESVNKKREADLEKITQMLFEARFPKAMETVDIEWKGGSWFVKGELYGPEHETFVEAAPEYIVEGELDFSHLKNLTETLGSSLRHQIESPNLLSKDLDGNLVHLDRIARLLTDYDEVAKKSNIPLPRIQLEVAGASLKELSLELDFIREQLTGYPHIKPDRFYPDLPLEAAGSEESTVHLKLIPSPAS
ncbi:MAG: hypothetical protein CMO55_01205 [Verrucomicrobiales bacterium]|nr:hypothetical protein [Verrucomicrobiales bacterium]